MLLHFIVLAVAALNFSNRDHALGSKLDVPTLPITKPSIRACLEFSTSHWVAAESDYKSRKPQQCALQGNWVGWVGIKMYRHVGILCGTFCNLSIITPDIQKCPMGKLPLGIIYKA